MNKSYLLIFLTIALTIGFFFVRKNVALAADSSSPCITDPVHISTVTEKFLPLAAECVANTPYSYCGRAEQKDGEYAPSPNCVTPKYIIMHTTHGDLDIDGIYSYFADGSGGRHVGSHFGIGQDGKIIQMVAMGKTQVEYAQAVGGMKEHISIEMGAPGNYGSKSDAPPNQYTSALRLVKTLMQTYNIPSENVQGHFDFWPVSSGGAGDPGEGWMKDFKADLINATPLDGTSNPSTSGNGSGSTSYTGCVITKVGNPTDPSPPLPADCNKGNGSGGGLPGGPCQAAPPLPANVKQAIIDKWGITLNIPDDQVALAWDEFYRIDCTGFLQDIKGTLVESWGEDYAQQFSCPGTSGDYGDVDVEFSNQWSGRFMQTILIHELTHVWQHCSSRGEQNLIDNDSAFAQEGGLTKYSRNECPKFTSKTPNKEDHADTIALYLNSDQGELTCGDGAPNPFAGGGHSLHRASAEKGVGKAQ